MAHREGQSCFEACLSEFPDFALHLTDEYMATLIESVCHNDNLQTLFVVCGSGQSQTIPHYMAHTPKILSQTANYAPIYQSLLSKDTPEQ